MESISEILAFPIREINGEVITVSNLIEVLVVLLVGYFVISRVRKVLVEKLSSRRIDQDLVLLLERLYLVGTMLLLGLFILSLLNVPLTAFAFVSGALAIGIGFGAQNILNNFISGWILMWERPIKIGDFLEINDVKGNVETINTRSTRIRRTDGVHLLIPNSQLLETMVVNWTLIDKLVRANVRVGVAYGSPVKRVAELMEKAAANQEKILGKPAPMVIFEDFGDNALVFDLYFWVHAMGEGDIRVIKSAVRFEIDDLFAQDNIVIAFPQRDIHVDGELKLRRLYDEGPQESDT